jgi:hypothetical protein
LGVNTLKPQVLIRYFLDCINGSVRTVRIHIRERTVVVIPAQQTVLEPDEAIKVRILLENINKDSDRARLMLEVTGLSFAES